MYIICIRYFVYIVHCHIYQIKFDTYRIVIREQLESIDSNEIVEQYLRNKITTKKKRIHNFYIKFVSFH